jgi:hypothetical protein
LWFGFAAPKIDMQRVRTALGVGVLTPGGTDEGAGGGSKEDEQQNDQYQHGGGAQAVRAQTMHVLMAGLELFRDLKLEAGPPQASHLRVVRLVTYRPLISQHFHEFFSC